MQMSGFDPFSQFALAPLADTAWGPDPVPAGMSGGALATSGAKPFSPDSPYLWIAGLFAVTFGLIGFSTHAHAGPARINVALGKD